MICNQTELADVFGVTPRTIQRWEDDGLPRLEDGRYDSHQAVEWRLEEERRRLERDMGAPDAWTAARTERMQALARIGQLEAAEREGELVPLDQYARELGTVLDVLRARLLATPGTIAPAIDCGCRPLAVTAAAVKAAINDVLIALQDVDLPEPEDTDARTD